MKKLAAMTLAFAMPVMALAQSVEGVWQTEPNDQGVSGLVTVSACGDAYCGVMTGNTAGSNNYVGKTIIAGMTTSDGVNFSGGTITDPTQNNTYNSKMTLSGNTLKVEVCILTFCRGQNWMSVQ